MLNLRTGSSETTLNYWMMVERCPNLKEEVGGLIPGCEISSLLDKKNLPGGQLPHVLWRWHVGLLSPKKKKKKKIGYGDSPPPPSGRRSLRVLVDYHLWWIENVQNITQIHKSVLWDS